MSSEDDKVDDAMIKFINGWAFPNELWFKTENILSCIDYKSLDGDIVLCSYPKTGSTWVQYIIWEILYKGESFPSFNDITYRLVPFMEVTGTKPIEALKKPRFYKNHFLYDMMKTNEKAKYVYVYRNPSDILVSFFHFNNVITENPLGFEEYFERFMNARVPYGDYCDHFLSFYKHRNDSNLLLISYEDLHLDIRGQVLRIAKFLGSDYYKMLVDNESLLKKILEVTSFNYMKKNVFFTVKSKDGTERNVSFFRKGIVGDGRGHLSKDQIKRINKKVSEKMKGTEFAGAWLV